MIIAIDGPAGTGKSTIAGIIAKKLGITYLNSGSFYRAITLACLENSINISDPKAVIDFAKTLTLDYKDSRLILNGTDVEDRLHEDKVSANTSQVSSIPEIRKIADARMHEITKSQSIVCEGRDMTTVVFPEAEYKFYLDASLEVQAQRRFDQGVSGMTLEEIKEAIKKRDEMDKNKAVGALKRAPDATYIDTSRLTIEEVCDKILSKIH
ncbi:MAG: (d)CMP kinase [Treponema sp.]|nr:(d)CMP kinase [Treponema sp.]